MTNISCLIVDDEPLSQDVLKKFIKDTPMLDLSGICADALEALTFLQSERVDLIFLDINMPKLSGIKFAKSLEHSPMIIFTTAYSEYAVEGFELDVVDYLLKPISFERFLKAVNKAMDLKQTLEVVEKYKSNEFSEGQDYIMIKADRKIYKINIDDIYYVQSYGDYVKIFTKEKTIIASETLKNMEQFLGKSFLRVHKSYLVAHNAVQYVEGNQLKVLDQMIPIGQKFREKFFKRFTKK
jgi:DNA-binding LytR/AlgR family response regulator